MVRSGSTVKRQKSLNCAACPHAITEILPGGARPLAGCGPHVSMERLTRCRPPFWGGCDEEGVLKTSRGVGSHLWCFKPAVCERSGRSKRLGRKGCISGPQATPVRRRLGRRGFLRGMVLEPAALRKKLFLMCAKLTLNRQIIARQSAIGESALGRHQDGERQTGRWRRVARDSLALQAAARLGRTDDRMMMR